jgi:predicted lipid-binding transport protein (Tim44 family)
MSQPFQQPGGFMRGLAGGIAGGILGGLLFRSLGFAGNGFGGGGIGLMDIILIGGILYAIYWFIKRKRLQESMAVSYRGTAVNEPMQPGTYSSPSASAA